MKKTSACCTAAKAYSGRRLFAVSYTHLDVYKRQDRLLLAKVLDRAEQSHSRNIPASTDFLSPQQRVMAQELLHLAGIPETAYAALGGYEGAERTILLFLPDWLEEMCIRDSNKAARPKARAADLLREISRNFGGRLDGVEESRYYEMCIRDSYTSGPAAKGIAWSSRPLYDAKTKLPYTYRVVETAINGVELQDGIRVLGYGPYDLSLIHISLRSVPMVRPAQS